MFDKSIISRGNKRRNKNYRLDVLLFLEFSIVIISSCFLHSVESEVIIWELSNRSWISIHAGASMIMIICVILHLVRHKKWFYKVYNIWLFVIFSIASLSGLVFWLTSQDTGVENSLSKLHTFSATIVILLIIWHLIIHWKWLLSVTLGSNKERGIRNAQNKSK